MNRKNRFVCFSSKWLLGVLLTFSISVKAVVLQDSALITINANNIPIEQVFRSIESQTNYSVFYNTKVIDPKERVSVNVSRERLAEAMDKVLKGKNLKWVIKGRGIIIMEKGATVPAGTVPVQTNERVSVADSLPRVTVSGTVTSDEGFKLPGATIKIKGTNIGTTTNAQGNFNFPNISNQAILSISYTGYQTQEFITKGSETLIVQLKRNIDKLDETIIIGYGSTSRRFNTGSVSKVTSEEISKQPVTNPLAALQGRVSGMFITTQNGLPGGNIKVQIRGKGSLAAGTDPLYIVDGVPFTSTSLNTFNSEFVNINGPVSPLNSIPPSEIESVEVLKDADATAIYGSRAANGVIMITTKKGQSGRISVNLNHYIGYSKVANLPQFLGLKDFLELRRESFRNDSTLPTATSAPDLLVWDTTKSTNWQKFILGGTAPVNQTEVSISGGAKNTTFALGMNYRKEGSILPGDQKYRRVGVHLSINNTSNDGKFNSNVTITYSNDKNNLIKSVDAIGIMGLAPNYPIYNPDGSLNWFTPTNPIAWLKQKSQSETDNIIANASFRYTIINGLNIKLNTGYSKIDMDLMSTLPKSSQWPVLSPLSSATFGNSKQKNYILEPQLDYANNFGKTSLKFLLGGTYQHSLANGYSIKGTNYNNEDLLESLNYAGSIQSATNSYSEYKYVSLFSRINLIHSEKYILTGSFRRDGSSKFGPGKRFGNFWAIGSGWIFSNENFFAPLNKIFSFGKLRASYGLTGNDQISNYQYLATYSAGLAYQGSTTLQPSLIANSDYSWESNKKFEVALELGAFRDKITATVARYRNRSGNQLVAYPISFISGFGSYQANMPGIIENSGWEIDLNSTNINTNKFTWTSSFNISIPKNILVSFPNIKSSSYANTYVVGEDLSIVKKLHFLGVDPQTGIAKFEDVNKDGNLTFPDDHVVIGKTSPDLFGGLNNSLNFMGIQLDIFLQFAKQSSLNNLLYAGITPSSVTNTFTSVLDRWRAPGDITNVQRATSKFGTPAYTAMQNINNSSLQMINTSYIRFKNISLSYLLPSQITSKIKLQKCRIYIEGQNIATIATTKNIDPETINGTSLAVPVLQTFATGIQITL